MNLHNLGKRFNRHWIFRGVNYQLQSGKAYAITGPNGSGKSTFLQIIAGAMQQSEGQIEMIGEQNPTTEKHIQRKKNVNHVVSAENHYEYISIAAPYLELIEELTLKEFLAFHFRFKPVLSTHNVSSVIDYIGLNNATDKQIRYFSSGMKQRVKLAQAIFSDVPVILLDEPITNLDMNGIDLYYQLVNEFCKNKLLIICSNDESEISFCHERLNITEFKADNHSRKI